MKQYDKIRKKLEKYNAPHWLITLIEDKYSFGLFNVTKEPIVYPTVRCKDRYEMYI